MLTFLKGKTKEKKELVDVREVFNIWDILKSKYDTIERFEIYQKFAHDNDLILIINNYIKAFKENRTILENLMRKYAIKGPDMGRSFSDWSRNTEIMRDEIIAQEILLYSQGHIENMLRTVNTSVTNDKVRITISKMMEETINKSEYLYQYLKLKGWIEVPPLYPETSADIKEIISCAEVANLWDHLTFRYDNVRVNKIYEQLTHDGDFAIVLRRGVDILTDQIEQLENECKKFGISLPKRPSSVIVTSVNTELIDDDAMYRDILKGLQGASILHIAALKQCVINDRIRGIFKNMFKKELGYYHNFIKYGKLKGWVHPVPFYRN